MIYYSDKNILIRDLQASDAQIITDEEIALYRRQYGKDL